MRTIKINNLFKTTVIELYDSIDDMPVDRYQEFQYLLLEDLGVGTDINAIGSHFTQLRTYIQSGKNQEALEECKNLHNNFYLMIEKISIKSLCIAPLIYKIDGKEQFPSFSPESFSKERVQKITNELCRLGMNNAGLNDVVMGVKKKLTTNLDQVFLVDTAVERLIFSPL